MPQTREELIRGIWTPPAYWKIGGSWFWWFWLFFIHDENTVKTGKCRQLMILWSIKKDRRIHCNSLDISIPKQIEREGDSKWRLNGAAAAWYFDGEKMHDDFVLEKSSMSLDPEKLALIAPGATPSSFTMDGDKYVTKISSKTESGPVEFEFRARQEDLNEAVGPVQGKTSLPLGMVVEGTMIERLALRGTETRGGKTSAIAGTAYFQKILVAAPPPQWYWGVYHFDEGSFLTFMVSYAGRATLADNAWRGAKLKKPTLPVQENIMFYHAPTGRVFKGNRVSVTPKKEGGELWSHKVHGKGDGFEIDAFAKAYAHSCWKFVKNVGALPAKSTFKYNEYPAVLERLELRLHGGEKIALKNGWGNMENSWGFLI
ncbi:hypothetical protein L0Y65_00965 [Candidatus Micrarchaeota archaeon]|nr:hypothetical protein [Candidatus Micrarchaeota archaeon]